MWTIGDRRFRGAVNPWAIAIVAAIAAGTGGASAQVTFGCGGSHPMFHAFDSYFECADALPVAGLAYQISNPLGVHTGTADILCETLTTFDCSSQTGLGDGKVRVQTDWGNPGIYGCPYEATGPQRIAIVVQGSDGRGLIVSLSGFDYNLDYQVEVGHKFDPATGLAHPLPCSDAAGQPQIQSRTTGIDGRVTLDLHFAAPLVHSDCDPDSLGMMAGTVNTCSDAFTPNSAVARVYTSVQACDRAVDLRRGSWIDTGVTPDASGNASVTVTPPATEDCVLVGYTATISGFESAIIGFVKVLGTPCVDVDSDGWTQCEGDCDESQPEIHPGATEACNQTDDNCNDVVDEVECAPRLVGMTIASGSPEGRGSGTLSWTSTREVFLAGFNVFTIDSNGRRTQINGGPIPCFECTTGRGHAYTYVVPKHRSGRNFYVEMVFVDDRVEVFGPAVKQ